MARRRWCCPSSPGAASAREYLVSRDRTGRGASTIVCGGESAMHELPSYRTILCATDGSDGAALAEDHALALARQTGARLEGVCVVDRRIATKMGDLSPEAAEEMKGDDQLVLVKLAERAQQAGIEVGTHLADGRVGPTILSEAARLGADLIV